MNVVLSLPLRLHHQRWQRCAASRWCFGASIVLASLSAHPHVAFALSTSGVVRLFVEKPWHGEAEPEAEVQLKVKTKRVARTRAVVKVEGRYYDREVYLKDAYLDHAAGQNLNVHVGIDKKALGLEYQDPSQTRLTLHRSSVYEYLEGLGLVGRQLQIRLRSAPEPGASGMAFDLAAGMDGSRDQNVLGSLRYQLGSWGVGGWGLVERHRIERTYIPVWAAVASLWLDTGRARVATELFTGVDAPKTEFERQVGDAHTVVFYGPRSEIALRFPISSEWLLEPFCEGSALARDARAPEAGFQAQFTAGLNVRASALVLRTHAEWIAQVTPVERASAIASSRHALYHVSLAYSF